MTSGVYEFPSFADAVSKFTNEAFGCLRQLYGRPRYGYPRNRYGYFIEWQRDCGDGELLRQKAAKPAWLMQYDELIWKGADKLCNLPSFREVERAVEDDQVLARLIYAAHGVIARVYAPNFSTLYLFLQDAILRPLIDAARSFEFRKNELDTLYTTVEKELISFEIVNCSFASLRDTWVSDTLDINSESTLRILSDEELSSGIEHGAIRPTYVGRGVATLTNYNQFAVCTRRTTRLNKAATLDSDFEETVRRSVELKNSIDLSERLVTALNLYCHRGGSAAGGEWREVRVPFNAMSSGGGLSVGPGGGRISVIDREEELLDFKSFFHEISRRSVSKRLKIPLERFSSATRRASNEESIVDLTISAESLFGASSPGEAMYRISLNAALFLADPAWPPSNVRAFFKEVYGVRSKIVHGTLSESRRSNVQDHNREIRDKLESAMRVALRKAISELGKDGHALDWDRRLNDALDSLPGTWVTGAGAVRGGGDRAVRREHTKNT